MKTIFDLIVSQATVAYWNEISTGLPPYLGEELLGVTKQKSTTIKFIKGANNVPTMLKQSAYDAKAVPRGRIGFETMMHEMPFFKESKAIDEHLQKELNEVLATNNQAYIDAVMNRIMNDKVELLKSARLTREVMVWQALTTGAISLSSNGQLYDADYGVPANHKMEVTVSWSDENAKIISDIRKAQDIIEDDTGVRPSRMVATRPTFNNITKNLEIKKTIFVAANIDAYLSDVKAKDFLMSELGVDVVIYDNRYQNSANKSVKFIPDDMAILLPPMLLGEMVFAETPEESNMYAGISGDVTITDTGVAVTAMAISDPVTVETKVSQVCMPSLPQIDKVMMIDVSKT